MQSRQLSKHAGLVLGAFVTLGPESESVHQNLYFGGVRVLLGTMVSRVVDLHLGDRANGLGTRVGIRRQCKRDEAICAASEWRGWAGAYRMGDTNRVR